MYLSVSSGTFYANALYVAKTTSLTWEEVNEFRLILAHILYNKTRGYFNIGENPGSYPYGSRIPQTDFELELSDKKFHIVTDDEEVTLMEETNSSNVYKTSDSLINDEMLKQINYYCSDEVKKALKQARDEYALKLSQKPLSYKDAVMKYRFNCNQ